MEKVNRDKYSPIEVRLEFRNLRRQIFSNQI